MMKGRSTQRTCGKGLLNVSPLSIRRLGLSLRGAVDPKGRSAIRIRGDPEEGPDIKDSLGTGLKIRSQGIVELAIQRNGCQTLALPRTFSQAHELTIRRRDDPLRIRSRFPSDRLAFNPHRMTVATDLSRSLRMIPVNLL